MDGDYIIIGEPGRHSASRYKCMVASITRARASISATIVWLDGDSDNTEVVLYADEGDRPHWAHFVGTGKDELRQKPLFVALGAQHVRRGFQGV